MAEYAICRQGGICSCGAVRRDLNRPGTKAGAARGDRLAWRYNLSTRADQALMLHTGSPLATLAGAGFPKAASTAGLPIFGAGTLPYSPEGGGTPSFIFSSFFFLHSLSKKSHVSDFTLRLFAYM